VWRVLHGHPRPAIVTVALPSIEADLGFSAQGLQWVVSAYALTFAGLLALCRCGASSLMPLCASSHRDVGFSGAKDPNRGQ
jgi:hypothetical protein